MLPILTAFEYSWLHEESTSTFKLITYNLGQNCCDTSGFSLGRLHMRGGQVQGDKALMGGTHEGGHRPYGGDLTLIDYIIN